MKNPRPGPSPRARSSGTCFFVSALHKAKLMKPSRSTTLEKIPILPSLGLVTLPKSLTHLLL